MESLSAVRRMLAERGVRFAHIEIPTEDIGLDDNGRLRVNVETFALGSDARKVIAIRAEVPVELFASSRLEIQCGGIVDLRRPLGSEIMDEATVLCAAINDKSTW